MTPTYGLAAAPAWRPPAFSSWPARIVAVLAVLALGAVTAHNPLPAVALFALPLLLALVVSRPEWILILFLTAGIYKQDPRITSVLPIDITVVMGTLLALAILVQVARRPVKLPAQGLLLVPLIAMLLHGLLGRAPDYGHEKALRFCTLTTLALLGSTILLQDRQRLTRFFGALAIVGFALSLDAIRQPETTTEGRLTAHGSNPISLARIGSLTLAFAWIRFQLAQKSHDKLLYIGVLAVSCICVLGAGSRGPVLSIVLATAAISFHTRRHHGRSPISIGAMLLIVAVATIVISFAAIPSLPLYRFQLLFSEDKGTSVLLRGMLMTTAFKLMLANPLGLGVGGFARHAVLDLRYPHNLFLEVGSELGWIPLIGLMLLMAWSIRVLFQILAREYSWSALFLSVVVLASCMNSMVTGDLNDNRVLFAVLLLPFAYRQSSAVANVLRARARHASVEPDRPPA